MPGILAADVNRLVLGIRRRICSWKSVSSGTGFGYGRVADCILDWDCVFLNKRNKLKKRRKDNYSHLFKKRVIN